MAYAVRTQCICFFFDDDFLFMVAILAHLLILKCVLHCTWLLNFDLDIIFAITVNRPILLFNTGTVQDRYYRMYMCLNGPSIPCTCMYVLISLAGFCLFCKSVHDDCVKRYLLNVDNIALVVFAQSSNRLLFHTWHCVYKKVWHIYLWCNLHVLPLAYVVCGKVIFSVMSVFLAVCLFMCFCCHVGPIDSPGLVPYPYHIGPPAQAVSLPIAHGDPSGSGPYRMMTPWSCQTCSLGTPLTRYYW